MELILRPGRGWLDLDWRGLLHYRDLLYLLVRRDFVARYQQTVLGPAWFILQPLLTTVVFTIVFGHIARLPTEGLPPLLFYLTNQISWGFFAGCFQTTAGTFTNHFHLFSKVYFPRLIVPLAGAASGAFSLVLQFATFFAFYAYFRHALPGTPSFGLTAGLWLLPVHLLQLALLGLGTGFWMASLTAKYRDLAQLSGILVQLWMYGTPVIYPLSKVPPEWAWAVTLNPVTYPVEAIRWALLGAGSPSPALALASWAATALLLLTGLMLFAKVEKTFVDVA